jgi:predicted ArsR family transcriptional regulator
MARHHRRRTGAWPRERAPIRIHASSLLRCREALERLRADGLIEVDREEIVDGRLRRYYRLTATGEERLAAEATRLQANAVVAMSQLSPVGAR